MVGGLRIIVFCEFVGDVGVVVFYVNIFRINSYERMYACTESGSWSAKLKTSATEFPLFGEILYVFVV